MNNPIFLSFILNTNPGLTGIIITESFRTSRNLFNETCITIKNQNDNNIESVIRRGDKFELNLKNGSRLFALPLNRECICGMRADFIITDVKWNSEEMKIIVPLIIVPTIKKDEKLIKQQRLQFIYNLSDELIIDNLSQ